MSCYTFTTEDGVFQVSVKTDFLKKVEKPEKVPVSKLFTEHGMAAYLHNETGPALHIFSNSYSEYWIDGRKVEEI